MKPAPKSAWNLDRLDARAFAQAGARLETETPLSRFARLREEAAGEAPVQGEVHWAVAGEMRSSGPAGAPSAPWMRLVAHTALPLTCQRCLGPVETPLAVDRWFRFVADEATAEAEDDDCEEDLLALEPRPNVFDVLEDELLMALPLVPMHEACPVPVVSRAGDLAADGDGASPARPHLFAALERLKKK